MCSAGTKVLPGLKYLDLTLADRNDLKQGGRWRRLTRQATRFLLSTCPSPTSRPLRLALAGCGQISNQYGENIRLAFRHLNGLEFHGDAGSFLLDNYHDFDARCQFVPYGGKAQEIPLLRKPRASMDRAAGLVDLALALAEDRPHRASAEQAAHVIEIMEGLQRSSDRNGGVEIHSTLPVSARGLVPRK